MPHATPQFHSAFYPHREPLLLSAGRERKETTIRVLLVHNNSDCCPVRVKDGMSLRNGMWHGLRNDIIMRNVIYAE